MDLSAIIIIILLGLPVFFFWRWVFRKNKYVLRKRLLTWLITIVSAPILYAVMIVIWLAIVQYYPNRDFDQRSWRTDSDRRYEYSYSLIQNKILIGKTKKQVEQILGETDTSVNACYYNIGYRPEITGIDPSNIEVDFKNGKAYTVIEHDK